MSLWRFPLLSIQSLVVTLFVGFANQAIAVGDAAGSVIDLITPQQSYSACTIPSTINNQKGSCGKATKAAQDACKSGTTPGGKVDGTTHVGAARQGQGANSDGAAEAARVAAACCPAAAACEKECGTYKSQASSCSSPDPNQIGAAKGEGQSGSGEADKALQQTCKQARDRCTQASQQKPANKDAQKDAERSEDQGKQGGGQPPQMPQMPQGGGDKGGSDSAATETAAADPCKDNPRNCQTAENTPVTTLSAAGGGDTTVNSDPTASSGVPSSSTGYTPASLSGGGTATAAGAYSPGAGGSGSGLNGNSGTKTAEEKTPNKLNANTLSGDGGSGGGGTASSYSGGDDDKATKGKVYPHMTAAGAAGRLQTAGMTGSGGRTNWEKVGIRYRDNTATFMKDDAQFFKPEPTASAASPVATPKK